MVFIPEMNDNFLKVLHFYGLHQIKSQSSLKKNSGFCALGIINPSLRKYDYFRRLAILSSAIWIICLTISPPTFPLSRARSEEHTSELQSRGHLVCRLLLEKKN